MKKLREILLVAGALSLAFINTAAHACPACYGKSDSPMAQGMNAGILSLLAVISAVLCGAATFFVVLARRASAASKVKEGSAI
jgi:hypothetical protein